MRGLFWRVVHRLPWKITRRICDLCDEFGRLARMFAESPATVTGPPVVGWTCPHMTMSVSGGYISNVSVWCGCTPDPIYQED